MLRTGHLVLRFALTCALIVLAAIAVRAEATDAQRLALELRRSEDRETRLLGQRWETLIRLQKWSDLTGQFTVSAKYVKHSEDGETVTLLVVKGTGRDKQEKEVDVPVEKLSKTCQARVKRIVFLRPILDEKLAEVEAEAEDDSQAQTPEQRFAQEEPGQLDEESDPRQRRPPRRGGQEMREEMPPRGEVPEEQPTSVENPYGGSRFITRDRLVEDRRFGEQPSRRSRPERLPAEAKIPEDPAKPVQFPDTDGEKWHDFYEPVGDESHMQARTDPPQIVAGQPTKIQVVVSSVYGRPKPAVWFRVGDPSQEFDPRNLDAGPKWSEMKLIGGKLMDPRSEEMVPLGQTKETPSQEQPGESHYQLEHTFQPGPAALEFKLLSALPGDKPVGFRGWDVLVSAVPSAELREE